jgi:hypothetical protein
LDFLLIFAVLNPRMMLKPLYTLLCVLLLSQVAAAQVIINEVQADAGNFEGGGEWIELLNAGPNAENLGCWRLTNGGSMQVSFPSGLILQPGQYLLVGSGTQMMCPTCDYKSLNTLFTLNADGFGPGSGAYANTVWLNTDAQAQGGCGCQAGTGALNNGSLLGDRIVLFNDAGTLMDALWYAGGDFYGAGALSVNFPGTASCPPLPGISIPATSDPVFNGRTVCNDLSGCNSSVARLPDGNNGATVSFAQSGNLACTGCLNPCGVATNSASADFPTPGLPNGAAAWTATLNGNPVTTTQTNLTVCGATPITFEYLVNNFTNVSLVATQSTGNLGSYVRTNTGNPVAFPTAFFNPLNGVTQLNTTIIPPVGTTNYEFVWGDANTNCAGCPGTASTSVPNAPANPNKECYVYHRVTVLREEPMTGSPTVGCSLPGTIAVSGAAGTNIQYTLQKQTVAAGPFLTVSGPQSSNAFNGVIDDDADPNLPNYQVLVTSTNTTCINPAPVVVAVPSSCMGNPACAQYAGSGPGAPVFSPAGGTQVCAGSTVQFSVDINGVCSGGLVEVLYDYNSLFDPYTQGTSLGTVPTVVGATPPTTTATGRVYISEFVPRPYNVAPCPSDGNSPNSGEYIELYNAGPGAVDISGWMITDGDWTATIPAGTKMAPDSYFLIGGGGTFCASGAIPDLNVETCNCTAGLNNGANGTDFMNLTNGSEGIGLFDCSNNFIDGVRWGTWAGDADGCPTSLPSGCGNYLTAKTPVLPASAGNQGTGLTNSGGGFSGTNGGRARDAAGNWTVTVNNSQFGNGFNGTPKAVNGAFTMWDGGATNFGTQCPPPPVTANLSVNLPDTCNPAGFTIVTLKAIYKPQAVAPCTDAAVTSTASYIIPPCEVLTLSGSGDFCNPATAPLSVSASPALTGNYDIVLSNGVNTATLSAVTGAGPFSTTVNNPGVWTISNVTPPLGVCPPKKTGSAVLNFFDIPAISNAPAAASFCYFYGFDLSSLNAQITTTPAVGNFVWYDQPSGGSPIGTFVNPLAPTTYYVAPTTGAPSNCEGARVPVQLNITPLPAVPTVSCDGITVTFTPSSPNCLPTPCGGLELSADGVNWSTDTSFTAADPGWAGWGSPLNSTLYLRNAASPACFNYVTYLAPCSAPLPARLLHFTGQMNNKGEAVLQWETADEQGLDFFGVERLGGGNPFRNIGQVAAKGTGPGTQTYSFVDAQPHAGLNRYRLRMQDVDKQYSYSHTISLQANVSSGSVFALFPNPVDGILNWSVSVGRTEKASIQVLDMTGRILRSEAVVLEEGANRHTMSTEGLTPGLYNLRLQLREGTQVLRFTRQ